MLRRKRKSDITKPDPIILRERFKQFSQISRDAAFIKLGMKVVSSVLEELISEMPGLVIPREERDCGLYKYRT